MMHYGMDFARWRLDYESDSDDYLGKSIDGVKEVVEWYCSDMGLIMESIVFTGDGFFVILCCGQGTARDLSLKIIKCLGCVECKRIMRLE